MWTKAPVMEPFTLVEESHKGPHHLFHDFVHLGSGLTADHDAQYLAALRKANPDTIVTTIPTYNLPLLIFAAAGNATAELDTQSDEISSWRGYVAPKHREDRGSLAEVVHFAKYHYKWNNEDFILYTVANLQYVIKEKRNAEHALGPSKITDALIEAAGEWFLSQQQVVWVYDRYWYPDPTLYKEVQKANWGKVILDEKMKKELTSVTETFFSSKDIYEDLGVPWKRGLLFYGPPGNGKTVSIKALMHGLLNRKDPIPTLYVKAAPTTYDVSNVFNKARQLAPCMLILEDIETIVTANTRSYFFNELDGLAGNNGLFVVASTNYLDRLDPGLTSRPSRFDRKYLFPLPSEQERVQYCEFWRGKLQHNKNVDFPAKLCPAMASITDGFSFAFLQECFVASLLELAREHEDTTVYDDNDLENYPLWVAFKKSADILRKEIHAEQAKLDKRLADEALFRSFGMHDPLPASSPTPLPPLPPIANMNGFNVPHDHLELSSMPLCGSTPASDTSKRLPTMSTDHLNTTRTTRPLPILPASKFPFLNTTAEDWRCP